MENQVVQVKVEQDRPENPITRAIVANPDGSITSSRCALCASKHRGAIEVMHEQGHHINTIKKFLEDNGEPMALFRIKHHLNKHFKNMEMQCAMIEYRDHLEEMMKRRSNMVDDIMYQTNIAIIELAKALVIDTGGDLDRELKKAKIISDHQKTIRDNYTFIMMMNNSEAKAQAERERFIKVLEEQLALAADDENKRNLVIALLQDFRGKYAQLLGP